MLFFKTFLYVSHEEHNMKKIKFIAAPFHLGANNKGIKEGYSKYVGAFPLDYVLDVSKFEEDFSNCKLKNLKAVVEMAKTLSRQTSKTVINNDVPITIGGDHSVALGTISGVSEQIDGLGVVWIDAHADMNTDETTPSGNIHGMILAALQGIGNENLTTLIANKIPTKNVAIFGTRDLDKKEEALMKKMRTNYFPYKYIESVGLIETLKQLRDKMNDVKRLHLSIDLDSLNPILVPGVSVPVSDGFSLEDILFILDFLFTYFEIVSIDVVEYNPIEDIDDKTLKIMKSIINHIVDLYR